MPYLTRIRLFLLVAAALLFAGTAGAQSPSPAARPFLTVSGKIAPKGGGDVVTFDRAQLEALGMQTMKTKTPWYPNIVTFEGIPLDTLLRTVGASGKTITAVALNDYASDIPVEDIAKYDVMLAIKRDGNYMPVSDKGPLFIVYPFDSNPELQNQKFFSRAVWQVSKIIVK